MYSSPGDNTDRRWGKIFMLCVQPLEMQKSEWEDAQIVVHGRRQPTRSAINFLSRTQLLRMHPAE